MILDTSKNYHLLLDTSCERAVVGIVSSEHDNSKPAIVAELFNEGPKKHAEQLAIMIASTLLKAECQFTELTSIIVGHGPGSFIGIRAAMSTAKGIALALNIPLYSVCSLLAKVPAQLLFTETEEETNILIFSDARKQEVYCKQVTLSSKTLKKQKAAVAISAAQLSDYVTEPIQHIIGAQHAFKYIKSEAEHTTLENLLAIKYPFDDLESQKEPEFPSALALYFAYQFGQNTQTGLYSTPNYCREADAKLPKKPKI